MTTTSDKRYDSELAALLVANYGEALRTAARLSTSLERTEDLFPLTGDALARLDDGGAERLDAFRVRFSDLQDLLAGKLFRGLLRLEEEPALSQLDVLNAMEKRGIIGSLEGWKALRQLRNAFAHDYPEHDDQRAEALTLAAAGAGELLTVLRRLRNYACQHVGLPPSDLPEPP